MGQRDVGDSNGSSTWVPSLHHLCSPMGLLRLRQQPAVGLEAPMQMHVLQCRQVAPESCYARPHQLAIE